MSIDNIYIVISKTGTITYFGDGLIKRMLHICLFT